MTSTIDRMRNTKRPGAGRGAFLRTLVAGALSLGFVRWIAPPENERSLSAGQISENELPKLGKPAGTVVRDDLDGLSA